MYSTLPKAHCNIISIMSLIERISLVIRSYLNAVHQSSRNIYSKDFCSLFMRSEYVYRQLEDEIVASQKNLFAEFLIV